MPNEAVTIYVTKDAPTRGITIAEKGPPLNDRQRYAIRSAETPGFREWLVVAPGEFFENIEDAIADAERRRARKLASLEAQIAAIRAIDLTRPVEG